MTSVNMQDFPLNIPTGVNGSGGNIVFTAGTNITLSQNLSTITIIGATAAGGPAFSLNGSSSSVSLVAGANITFNSGASSITIVGGAGAAAGTQSLSAGGNSVTGTAISLALAAGANITLNTATAAGSLTVTIVGPSVPAATNFSLNGSSSSVSLVAGANITFNSGASSITVVGPAIPAAGSLSFSQLFPMQEANPLLTSSSNAASSLAIGSSLFLNRIFLPAAMKVSELDVALGLAYAATNSGAGTLSQSFVIYSFGNSTSLASVASGGGSSTWGSGTSTTAGAASITQFQQAWSGQFVRPLTFASTSLASGEYVVGLLINMSFANASWSFSLYGGNAVSLTTGSVGAATALAAISSLSGASSFATGSSALTAFTAAPTVASDLANAGTAQMAVLSNAGTAGTNLAIGTLATTSFSATSQISSLAARTVFTAAPTVASRTVWSVAPTVNSVLSNAGTAAASLALSMATASIAAVTNVALAALGTSTLTYASTMLPSLSYQYQGTSSAIPANVYPTGFDCGILSTGATTASIALTATNLISTGSAAILQPWFAMLGA